jgi:hypothetical protein
VAVATNESQRRKSRGSKTYHQDHKLSTWNGNHDLGINKSLANATAMMLGRYPTSKREAFRALAESKRGDERTTDDAGCRFTQPSNQVGRRPTTTRRHYARKREQTTGYGFSSGV